MNRRPWTVAAIAAAWIAQSAVAQPAPLGPEVAIDRAVGVHTQCLLIAGRGDGSFLALSRWVETRDSGESVAKIFFARSKTEDTVVASSEADSQPGPSGVSLEGLTANLSGYTALWRRELGGVGVYVALALEEDGTPVGDARARVFTRRCVAPRRPVHAGPRGERYPSHDALRSRDVGPPGAGWSPG